MPRLLFGLSSYERGRGDLPDMPVVNMAAEEAPTEAGGVVLQSRPGLADRANDMGSGPVDCLFKRDGVLDGALFGVSDGGLYQDGVLIGSLPGSGVASIAGNEVGLVATAGGAARYYDGTTLSSISFPDGADVAKVFQGASRFWMIRKDTGKLYFTPPLTATVDALDFITAESLPDKLLDGLWLDDAAILGGAESVEFWPNTDDDDLPIRPQEGLVSEDGLKATGCLVRIGTTFALVTNTNQVRLGLQGDVISNPGLEERIAASTSCRLFAFTMWGNEFLGLRIDNETQVWGLRSKLWSEFRSHGHDNWLPQCFAGGVFGSSVDGKTLAFDSGWADLGGEMLRLFRAGTREAAGQTIDNLILQCSVGQTSYLSGDFANPVVEQRKSLDEGRTWGNWRPKSLGPIGDYGRGVVWLALGMLRRWKGLLFEFRVTAPVDWRVSGVAYNERFWGR